MRANTLQLLSCEKQSSFTLQGLQVTSHLHLSSPKHTTSKAFTARKTLETHKALEVLLLYNVFNFIFIYMCFSHTLTNFVQFFTANESHDSFIGGPWKLQKKHVHSICMELEYRRVKHRWNLCPSIFKAEIYQSSSLWKTSASFKRYYCLYLKAIFQNPAQ